MKGSIRVITGLIFVLGGAGGMEVGSMAVASFGIALTGLALMGWGVLDMNGESDA